MILSLLFLIFVVNEKKFVYQEKMAIHFHGQMILFFKKGVF